MTLEEAVSALMRRGKVLVAVDFDGTLAPLVDDPADSVPDAGAIRILTELASHPDVTVAVVSGRALADLAQRLGHVPGALLVGEHGNDTGGGVQSTPDLDASRELVAKLNDEIGPVTVEEKPRSVTIHTRGLDASAAAHVASQVRSFSETRDGISLLQGKQVFELTTATRTKGTAIAELAAQCDAVLYIGDDATDETVFEILEDSDVAIKVGEGPTAARYRVANVSAVVGVLRQAALALS